METNKKYIATSTSFKTAEIEPIVLSEKERVQTLLKPYWVEGNHKEKSIGATIIYKKTAKKFGDIQQAKLGKREINAGEYLEFNLDRDETLKLFQSLSDLYKISNSGNIQLGTTEFIEVDEKIKQIQAFLNDDSKLSEFLKQSALNSLSNLSNMVNIEELNRIDKLISDKINSDENEQYWQELFEQHNLAISQIFIQPFIYLQSKPYFGGKQIDNTNGQYGDILLQNIKTNNVAIMEIKTPKTKLVNSTPYRNNVYSPHTDLSGAISQVINEADTFLKSFFTLQGISKNQNKKFSANNIKNIVIIGNLSSLNDEQKESFDKFRNDLRKTEIITFDELQAKIKLLIKMLQGNNEIEQETESDDEPSF